MGRMTSIPLVGTSSPSQSIDLSQQKNVNFYPVIEDNEVLTLHTTPGATLTETVSGVGRGSIVFEGTTYCVIGSKFYSYDGTTVTEIGTLSVSTNEVKFASSGLQLLMVDGISGYSYTFATTTFAEVTDPQFPAGSTHVAYIDGYFICTTPNTGNFSLSDSLNADSWSGNVQSAEGSGDYLVAPMVIENGLWLIGTETTELYVDSGVGATPFVRVDGSVIDYGCHAPNSIAKSSNSFMFLAKGVGGGVEPIIITRGKKEKLFNQSYINIMNRLTSTTDATGFVYSQDGHEFYVLSFPTDGVTYVHDLTIGQVHERTTLRNLNPGRWLAGGHFYLNGKNYVFDFELPYLYVLSTEVYTDNLVSIIREVRSTVYRDADNIITANKLNLQLECGVGIAPGSQGDNPTVMMNYSTDGGHSYQSGGDVQIGTASEHEDQAIWYCLGEGRKWCFSFTFSDPVKWIVLGLTVDFTRQGDW